VPSVCWEWNELSRSDEIWQTFYRHKFLRNNTVMGRYACVFISFLLLVSSPALLFHVLILHVFFILTLPLIR